MNAFQLFGTPPVSNKRLRTEPEILHTEPMPHTQLQAEEVTTWIKWSHILGVSMSSFEEDLEILLKQHCVISKHEGFGVLAEIQELLQQPDILFQDVLRGADVKNTVLSERARHLMFDMFLQHGQVNDEFGLHLKQPDVRQLRRDMHLLFKRSKSKTEHNATELYEKLRLPSGVVTTDSSRALLQTLFPFQKNQVISFLPDEQYISLDNFINVVQNITRESN